MTPNLISQRDNSRKVRNQPTSRSANTQIDHTARYDDNDDLDIFEVLKDLV